MRLRIGGRLIAGLGALCALLTIAVCYTISVVGEVATDTRRMLDQRAPTAMASADLLNDLNSTMASLRGYLLTGGAEAKAAHAAAWKDLDASMVAFDRLAEHFAVAEHNRQWTEAKALIAELREVERRAEAIAFTPDASPATKLLGTEATPRFDTIVTEAMKIIEVDQKLDISLERAVLIKDLADMRTSLAIAMAHLRMFLLTAEPTAKEQFAAARAHADRAFSIVDTQERLLAPIQRATFNTLARAYEELKPLPDRIIALRESPQYNMPAHILSTEAQPRTRKILELLDGIRQSDGTHAGGLKTSQKALMAKESEELEASIAFLQRVEWVLLAAGLAVAGIVGFLTVRSVVPPIRGMTAAMGLLAGGNTAVAIPGVGRRDEIGEMAKAVQVFKDSMIETERLRAEQTAAQTRAAAEKRLAMGRFADAFEASVGNILEAVSTASTELEATANTLTRTADVTRAISTSAAGASEEASANVRSVSTASEQLAGSINEISRRVQEASRMAVEAVGQAQKTNSQITALSQSAGRIGDVVRLITAIAEQTNLLALNATIEAARAGDAGRGFAVVAQEVKALAAQTAKATEEIGGQISGMQAVTTESVAAMKAIGETITRISDISSTIAAAVEEQGAATQEISRNVQQAASGTSQVAGSIAEVSRGANETGSASAQVLSSAQALARESNHLKSEVHKFLVAVRAA